MTLLSSCIVHCLSMTNDYVTRWVYVDVHFGGVPYFLNLFLFLLSPAILVFLLSAKFYTCPPKLTSFPMIAVSVYEKNVDLPLRSLSYWPRFV